MQMENRQRTFTRLTLNERIQHFFLLASFTALVLTGAPLFYPKLKIFHLLIPTESLFKFRGALHRGAALVLVLLFTYHVMYLLFSARGRKKIGDLIPRKKDFTDFVALIKYNLGITHRTPLFGRYNMLHKFEYWAFAWGSLVMIGSGFLLWFKIHATIVFPRWVLEIMRIVHGDEALLAFLTIAIWHFYNVLYSPDVFPMSKTWITGEISEEEMKRFHPLEYEEILGAASEEGILGTGSEEEPRVNTHSTGLIPHYSLPALSVGASPAVGWRTPPQFHQCIPETTATKYSP